MTENGYGKPQFFIGGDTLICLIDEFPGVIRFNGSRKLRSSPSGVQVTSSQ